VDPANKPRINGEAPRDLTFAQARPDDLVAGGAFHRIRLPANSVNRQ